MPVGRGEHVDVLTLPHDSHSYTRWTFVVNGGGLSAVRTTMGFDDISKRRFRQKDTSQLKTLQGQRNNGQLRLSTCHMAPRNVNNFRINRYTRIL